MKIMVWLKEDEMFLPESAWRIKKGKKHLEKQRGQILNDLPCHMKNFDKGLDFILKAMRNHWSVLRRVAKDKIYHLERSLRQQLGGRFGGQREENLKDAQGSSNSRQVGGEDGQDWVQIARWMQRGGQNR